MCRRLLHLIGFLLAVEVSLSADIKTNEFENVTLDFTNYLYQTSVLSVVNKNNVTVATRSTPQQYFSLNRAVFTDRYSVENYSAAQLKINIVNVTISDAGTYSCIDSTRFINGGSHNLLVFRKPDPPEITLESVSPDIGDRVILNCEGSSRSAAAEYFQNQSMTYQWYIDGEQRVTGQLYTIYLTKSLRNQEISCTIKDSDANGIESNSSQLLILLPKDTATLLNIGPSPLDTTFKIMEGSGIDLKCNESRTRTPPISKYLWTKDGEPILGEEKETLIIARANGNHSGEYGCQAENSEGLSNIVNKTLEVLEGPVLTTVRQIETSGNRLVELSCNSSLSGVDIVWTESGSANRLHVGSTFNTRVTKSTNFTCQVSAILTPTDGSPIIKEANSTISVIYKYPPVRKTDRFKITHNMYMGNQFEEIIEYDAYPEVTNASLQTFTGLQTKLNVKLAGNTVQIFTDRLIKEDCTSFKMVVRNTEGLDAIEIHIHCYPLAPSDLTATLSGDRVTLKWTPGFDGGRRQIFKVYLSSDGKNWTQYYSDHDENKDTGLIETTVTGLSPEKIHLFKIIAHNGLSSGDSNIAFTAPRKETVSDSGAVIGGTISGVLILVIIAIGIFIYLKYHYIPAHRGNTGTTSTDKESDYERPVTRSTAVVNDLEDYDTIQKCQYENMTYNARTEYINSQQPNNPYENLKHPVKKPIVLQKPVKPKKPPKPKSVLAI